MDDKEPGCCVMSSGMYSSEVTVQRTYPERTGQHSVFQNHSIYHLNLIDVVDGDDVAGWEGDGSVDIVIVIISDSVWLARSTVKLNCTVR